MLWQLCPRDLYLEVDTFFRINFNVLYKKYITMFSFSATAYTACTGRRKKRAVSFIEEQASELEVAVPEISVSRVERYVPPEYIREAVKKLIMGGGELAPCPLKKVPHWNILWAKR